jgi:hypothetical protein
MLYRTGTVMRRKLIALMLAGAALTGGCATTVENFGETPWTPMTVADWSSAPEGPFRAAEGDRILTQYLIPSRAVTLLDEPRVLGPASARVSAGDRLFSVVGDGGVSRFCSAGAIELLCFEDVNGDGAFERAWTAAAHPSFPMAVRRWTDRRGLAAPVRFSEADPFEGPRRQIAIRYLGRTRTAFGFALQVGGPDDFSDIAWTSRTAWIAPDETGAIEFAGARITVLETDDERIVYRLQSAMAPAPLTLQVSTATRTLDALVALEGPAA